jgi:hypothetical protein
MYRVPSEYYVRLHHCRPRFKNNIENVLLYVVGEICLIEEMKSKDFASALDRAIRLFPGNALVSRKTIQNWRTEISSLFGLIQNTEVGNSKASAMAELLNTNQDLIEFFRYFCYKFQYPGGHLKPEKAAELINLGVKFKPVKYILQVLNLGMQFTKRSFGLTKEEVTHCIFNDLRVVRDQKSPEETLSLIMENREKKIEYDAGGDVVRYAGDILDYMVLANLLNRKINGNYYAKTSEVEVLRAFTDNDDFFSDYDDLYQVNRDIISSDVSIFKDDWFDFVNSGLESSIFQTDIFKIVEEFDDERQDDDGTFITDLLNSIRIKQKANGKIKTKEIGDVGEAIAIQHEQIRLIALSRNDLAKKVVKMPEALACGYDLNSYEGEAEIKRFIEVKTTISKNRLNINRFSLTPTEWGAASTSKEAYFIYRLMISSDGVSLFVMQDPVALYKKDLITMTPRNGADISYSEKSGCYEQVLM